MLRSLSSQLALIIGSLFLLTAIGLFQWFFYSSQHFADEVEQSLHRALAGHIIHDNSDLDQGIIEQKSLKQAFHTQMLLGPEWEFYALDPQGNILAYSAPTGVVKRKTVSLEPIKAFINGKTLPIYADDPRNLDKQKIFSVAPINQTDGQLAGYLYVIIGGEKRDTLESLLASSKVLKDSALILASAILFGLLALILVITIITRPLKQLSKRSLAYVNNDFKNLTTTEKPFCAAKEIKDLDDSFASAAQHINTQLTQIKTTEQLRRELLSHISHDFRTPLTALNGYLETWLISPKDKRSDQLIEIALKNGYQINQLVEQLFELARLESGDIHFNPEPVNVIELAHDVIQSLRFHAQQKQVELAVIAKRNNLAIQAYADIAKLERVLVNLIDNAIRHTPNKGKVEIAIIGEAQQIKVQVNDTGTGIPDSELQAIFEPKYRATNSTQETHHAGLGLSIVKRLLDMHNSQITVSSQLNYGCSFSFDLPYAMATVAPD